jgi:DNA-binding LacI/PurR family transcriptional regulator
MNRSYPRKTKAVSQKTIAQKLHLSVSSVSRALCHSGSGEHIIPVSPNLVRKAQKLFERYNYVYHANRSDYITLSKVAKFAHVSVTTAFDILISKKDLKDRQEFYMEQYPSELEYAKKPHQHRHATVMKVLECAKKLNFQGMHPSISFFAKKLKISHSMMYTIMLYVYDKERYITRRIKINPNTQKKILKEAERLGYDVCTPHYINASLEKVPFPILTDAMIRKIQKTGNLQNSIQEIKAILIAFYTACESGML